VVLPVVEQKAEEAMRKVAQLPSVQVVSGVVQHARTTVPVATVRALAAIWPQEETPVAAQRALGGAGAEAHLLPAETERVVMALGELPL